MAVLFRGMHSAVGGTRLVGEQQAVLGEKENADYSTLAGTEENELQALRTQPQFLRHSWAIWRHKICSLHDRSLHTWFLAGGMFTGAKSYKKNQLLSQASGKSVAVWLKRCTGCLHFKRE